MPSAENPFQSLPEQDPKDQKLEVFDRLFRYGTIEKILENELPAPALQYFDGMNRSFVDPKDPPQVFNEFYNVYHVLISNICD